MIKPVFSREAEDVLQKLCSAVGTPRAQLVSELARKRDWDSLVSLETDPRHYNNPWTYRGDAIVTSFLRKAKDLPTSFDKAQKALDNFWLAERDCYSTNERLSPYLFGSYPDCDEGIYRFLRRVRKNLISILGTKCPDVVAGRFGPGTTFSDRGRYSTVPDKMSSNPTFTPESLSFLFQWSGTAWASACANSGRDPVSVRGNRFMTVPKDCRKDRGIAVEPSINVFYQLGYGKVIRDRLRSVGLDIETAQEKHKRVACEASIKGHLATIDLSNASDTVSFNLVKLLLPHRWFETLASLRSPYSLVRGKWVKLEKFSSMGNGFTFELETLIFLSVCKTVMEDGGITPEINTNLLVFGDDIIVPTEIARDVIAALRFLGFTPNKDKTFIDGPFRESCGGDYFSGVDVRPFYLKKSPKEPHELIALANGLSRLDGEDHTSPLVFPNIRRAWLRVLDAIPSDIRRCRGPRVLGDLVICDHETRWSIGTRAERPSVRYLRVWKPIPTFTSWKYFRPDVVLAAAVYGEGDGERGVTPRNSVSGYKHGWVAYS